MSTVGKKKRKTNGPSPPKNALMQLNELKPGLEFKFVSQTGPVHAPMFNMSVEVNGMVFEGSSTTKKASKLAAAEKALKSFVQFPNASDAHKVLGPQVVSTDFTSDVSVDPQIITGFFPSGLIGTVDFLGLTALLTPLVVKATFDTGVPFCVFACSKLLKNTVS
jgi:hypothetical protein